MVTYTVKPGRELENAALVRAVFAELAQIRPVGLRYAVFQLPDTRQFIHLYTDEGSALGLQALASFQAFAAAAKDRHEQPAALTEPELIGDYQPSIANHDRLPSIVRPGRPADRVWATLIKQTAERRRRRAANRLQRRGRAISPSWFTWPAASRVCARSDGSPTAVSAPSSSGWRTAARRSVRERGRRPRARSRAASAQSPARARQWSR